MKKSQPIVMISSYSPRYCGIATFCEEAREFIQKANPDREILVISHIDGAGAGVSPLIDMKRRDWWEPVTKKIKDLDPYAVHIEHEYGLYEYFDRDGNGDRNQGFIDLLKSLRDYPTIVEPHTIHGRLTEFETQFVSQMCQWADLVLFKCSYQKWRLDWTFPQLRLETPRNVMVVPHGVRPDKAYTLKDVTALRTELGLDKVVHLGKHLVGLVGWIQANKRWDILTTIWEEVVKEIKNKCKKSVDGDWDLLAAGILRGNQLDQQEHDKYMKGIQKLEKKNLAYHYEFTPRGELYYKVLAICDFVVLPSVDETQSGTLARVIALNKPFITIAPMEGLTAQTVESGGGLLFTDKESLRKKVIDLACNEKRRMELGNNLKKYLRDVVSWKKVAGQYNEAYELAREAKRTGKRVSLEPEF